LAARSASSNGTRDGIKGGVVHRVLLVDGTRSRSPVPLAPQRISEPNAASSTSHGVSSCPPYSRGKRVSRAHERRLILDM
jgi:hypothetical protein